MEKRLTAQGPRDRKSYTVTLPIEWVKQEKLDRTRTVTLEIVGHKAVISAAREAQERVLIDGEEYQHSLVKVFQGLYRAGINEVRVSAQRQTIIDDAIAIIEKNLIGYEVIEQKGTAITIRDITKESEEDFTVILRRVFLLLLQYPESTDSAQLRSLEKNTKKLINYCQRILMKKGHAEFMKTPVYFLILDRLEKIGDEFSWYLQTVLSKKKKVQAFQEVCELFRKAYGLFYKFEPSTFNACQYRSYTLKNKIKLEDRMNPEVMHLHNLCRLINSLYGDIFMVQCATGT